MSNAMLYYECGAKDGWKRTAVRDYQMGQQGMVAVLHDGRQMVLSPGMSWYIRGETNE